MKKITLLTAFGLAVIVCFLCGCHVFAWYIPKDYGEEKRATYYNYIRNEMLTNLPSYIANIDAENGTSVNIWNCGGKVIMNFDEYGTNMWRGAGVCYDGVFKHWDSVTRVETIEEVGEDYFEPYFDKIYQYAEFLKTVVGTEFDDGYFHDCFPWGFGMAQIYYDLDEELYGANAKISASWTSQKIKKNQKKPLISDAEFTYYTPNGRIGLQLYAEPYDIDVSIENILNNYENNKQRTEIYF